MQAKILLPVFCKRLKRVSPTALSLFAPARPKHNINKKALSFERAFNKYRGAG
jgi:hypothetical protein